MFSSRLARFLVIAALFASGVWLLLAAPRGPAPESASRQQALQAFAPAPASVESSAAVGVAQGKVPPVVVNLRDIPAGVYDPNNQLDRWRRGEIDLDEREGMRSAAELAQLKQASARLPASRNVQVAPDGPGLNAPTAGVGFDSIDYTECCGGGGNVPPDPELAVGPNHVIAVVNVAFEIYNTSGASLRGPTTFASFMNADPNCSGVFDPNVLYDESADRFILGIDADGTHYCLAVSQSGDPTLAWNLYSFATGSARDFFDYPHAGVGNDAIYMGGNIFRCGGGPFGGCSFKEARVWAFDKAAMYAGQSAASATVSLGNQPDSPQPLNLHGWNQGSWPTSGPHYFFTNATYDGANYNVYSWGDPFGANNFSPVGTINLVAATDVSAGMPVDVPQLSGQTIQANDFRPQDFEYRNGYAWSVQTIACNPGNGTVDCIRWAQIDPANATVVNAGVYASDGEYRTFGDLAVDACDGMAVGYTKSSSAMYPGIWVTGRLSTDPAGTLQAESQLKAGDIAYTSFETSAPRRWGDYTEMTIAPDGSTFWYLGEYSKNTGTSNGRWGTYIGSFSYSCDPGSVDNPPSVTLTSPADGATVSGTAVDVTANASDDNGVTQVEFFVDGNSIGVDTTAPYEASWDSTSVADGSHTISATATDTIGQTRSDSINVSVDNVADPTISLSVTAYKVRGVQHADLTWSGATSTNVDIFRDGGRIATTPNDGTYTDNLNRKGGGSATYQVCEAGTSSCSNLAVATW